MPFRRGYDKEREDDETTVLLDQESIRLESLHYKKSEDNDSRKIRMTPDQTIECEIQPSDNLASFSLKYRVPIAEIKRVNNILTEQGFYALKRIKIPVKPYSLLLSDHMHESGEGKNKSDWLGLEEPSASTDSDRMRKEMGSISIAEDQPLSKEPLRIPLMASKIREHPGDQSFMKNFNPLNPFRSGCSNRALLIFYCCSGVVGFLTFVALMVHISKR